jgi:hypothetical protein
MQGRMTIIIGGLLSIVLVVSGLWAWQSALRLSAAATRPEVALWSVRSGAVALAAVAQLLILTLVVRRARGSDFPRNVLRVGAGLVAGVALVSALALGLAGR